MALLQSSRIVVLHLTKYGDSGLVVHTIDSEAGRCSYMLRGVGRASRGSSRVSARGSSVSVGSFHNLAVLDIVSVANPRSSMALIKDYEPALRLYSLRSDVVKNTIALFISELLYRTVVEQNCDERLFDWLCDTIARLNAAGTDADAAGVTAAGASDAGAAGVTAAGASDAGAAGTPSTETSVANFHLWFLAGFCTVMGFGPAREGLFDGCDLLRADNLALLRQLTAADFPDAMAIPLTGSRRRDFCEQMVRYISYHLGINVSLRSLDALHDLYR